MLFNIEEIEVIVKMILWTEPALQSAYEGLSGAVLFVLFCVSYWITVINTPLYLYVSLTELRCKY